MDHIQWFAHPSETPMHVSHVAIRCMYEVLTLTEHWWVHTRTSPVCFRQTVLKCGTTTCHGSQFLYTRCQKIRTMWVYVSVLVLVF